MTPSPAAQDRQRVLTLNFHGIGAPGRPMEPGEERFWITPDAFHGILDAAVAHPRNTALTFDDANESDVTEGLPGLVDRGLHARFFVITDRIDHEGSLSSPQLDELRGAGMSFGTHGASHRPWTDLAKSGELVRELQTSRRRLGDIVGERITHAAFPQGMYDRSVLRSLRRQGFDKVYSVDEGWSPRKAWLRSRYSVINTDTPDSIRALLDDPYLTSDRWPVRPVKQVLKRWR